MTLFGAAFEELVPEKTSPTNATERPMRVSASRRHAWFGKVLGKFEQ
jgi:hypothetical protein